LFHTLLGLFDVRVKVYEQKLDFIKWIDNIKT
jgi:hypothetical protein